MAALDLRGVGGLVLRWVYNGMRDG